MKYQDGLKPAKWDAQFQAYDIEGKAVLEALKKLTVEIAVAFSAVSGQEISEEEVSLIRDIQLPKEEMNGSTEDIEASEVSEGK